MAGGNNFPVELVNNDHTSWNLPVYKEINITVGALA